MMGIKGIWWEIGRESREFGGNIEGNLVGVEKFENPKFQIEGFVKEEN